MKSGLGLEMRAFAGLAVLTLSACGSNPSPPPPPPQPAANQAPIADAGPDQSVAAGANVTLDGSRSRDPDGTIASFRWTQTAGPSVTLTGASTAQAGFTAPSAGPATLTFQLSVTDNLGAQASDSITVTLTAPASAPLTLASASPTEAASNVLLGGPLSFTFSRPLAADSVSTANFMLSVPGAGAAVAANVSLQADGTTVLVRPSADLKPNLDYRMTISGVRGASGELQAGPVSINFRTQNLRWHAGAYALFAVGQVPPASSAALSGANARDVAGAAFRFSWDQFEDDQGNYNFADLDNALAAAASAGKRASIVIFPTVGTRRIPAQGRPARFFYSPDANPNSPNFGRCIENPVPLDANFRARFYAMLRALGNHLTANPALNDVVAYVNGAGDFSTFNWAYGASFQNVFTDPACTQAASWASFGFTADSLISALNESLDEFMRDFPGKPQWFSVGTTNFQAPLSCGTNSNCIWLAVADRARALYPDRFGIWREDLSANRDAPVANTIYDFIAQFRPRIGAQMVFSTLDCPGDGVSTRCRLASPGTSPGAALTAAIEVGASNDPALGHGYYLMPYEEIYATDVMNPALTAVFADIATRVQWRSDVTPPAIPAGLQGNSPQADTATLSWLASNDRWDKENSYTDGLPPSPARRVAQSVIYRVYRDGVFVASTDQTSFRDVARPEASARYAVSAVDAAGNESARSPEIIVAIQ